jgi:hypothetical protein
VYFPQGIALIIGFILFKELKTLLERAFLDLDLSKFLLEFFEYVLSVSEPLGFEIKRFLSNEVGKVPSSVVIIIVFVVVR